MKSGCVKNKPEEDAPGDYRENVEKFVAFFVGVVKTEFGNPINSVFPDNASGNTFFGFSVID